MRRRFGWPSFLWAPVFCMGLLLACSSFIWAALGEGEDSVRADAARWKSSHRVLANARYATHELKSGSGQTVREFVSPSGTVFAVEWEGPSLPDLRRLLGAYHDQYQQAIASRAPSLNAPIVIETPTLVLYHVGHMRAFHGRAYVPGLAPKGVTGGEVR